MGIPVSHLKIMLSFSLVEILLNVQFPFLSLSYRKCMFLSSQSRKKKLFFLASSL